MWWRPAFIQATACIKKAAALANRDCGALDADKAGAIAQAADPVAMARAMKLGIEAGRAAYLAGRIAKKAYASASTTMEGMVGS